MSIAQNLDSIKEKINQAAKNSRRNVDDINLVAVSKTIAAAPIEEAIQLGCKIFGENRVTEAKEKWPELKLKYPEIKLHLIGHLQSNKAADAVKLFDVIESLDSEKLAKILSFEMKKQNKFPEIFIQINIGEEPQKSGINPRDADQFIQSAINDYGLPVTGVMAIPPVGEDPALYFALLANIARNNNLKNISMGMSGDFEIAIAMQANFIRLGSAIFGQRNSVAIESEIQN
jgi:pyridoxal phosphate enzyme (YggS family)